VQINRVSLGVVLALVAIAGFGCGLFVATSWATPNSEKPTATAAPSATLTLTNTPAPTKTRAPTKTPRPARPIKKLGPEISMGTNVVLGKPPVLKLRNVTREYVGEVRQTVGPDTLIIIRFQQGEPKIEGDPRQVARDWYASHRDDILAMKALGGPNIAFETAINECPDEHLDWYVQFSLELIPMMHNDGVRVVAGNPAVGGWGEENWPKFKPVLNILKPDDFLGLHEYWVDTADLNNRWHVGRWTIPEIAAVIGNTKIVITECGRDVVEGRGKPGWQLTCDADTYLWDLETYDALLRQYPNVVGACVFTIDKNWPKFEVYDIWPQVVFRYSLTPTPQPAQPAS